VPLQSRSLREGARNIIAPSDPPLAVFNETYLNFHGILLLRTNSCEFMRFISRKKAGIVKTKPAVTARDKTTMNDQSWNGETNVIVNRRTAVFVTRDRDWRKTVSWTGELSCS